MAKKKKDYIPAPGKPNGLKVVFNGGPGYWSYERVEKTDEYPDLVSGEELLPDTTYYMVYCIWSTGDSFGHTDGAYCEGMAIYPSFETAKLAAMTIRTHVEEYKRRNSYSYRLKPEKNDPPKFDEYSVMIPTWDGTSEVSISTPWNGYFESLDSIQVQHVRLNEGCFSF